MSFGSWRCCNVGGIITWFYICWISVYLGYCICVVLMNKVGWLAVRFIKYCYTRCLMHQGSEWHATFRWAPRRKAKMPIQRLRKTIRQANRYNRHIRDSKTRTLRLSVLHVKTRHKNWQLKNNQHQTNRISHSFWFTSQMCSLQRAPTCTGGKHTITRRMPNLSESHAMQHTQKIDVKFSRWMNLSEIASR